MGIYCVVVLIWQAKSFGSFVYQNIMAVNSLLRSSTSRVRSF